MSLEQQVNDSIKDAMRAKNEAELRGLRAIKAAVLMQKTEGGKKETLSEEEELKILQKLAKQRREAMDIFIQQNREDLAFKEKEELEIIERYLPKPLSEEELKAELEKIVSETGASSPADMGKVMGVASKKLAGKADGKTIANMVKSMLA